jgi:hypothetical protein
MEQLTMKTLSFAVALLAVPASASIIPWDFDPPPILLPFEILWTPQPPPDLTTYGGITPTFTIGFTEPLVIIPPVEPPTSPEEPPEVPGVPEPRMTWVALAMGALIAWRRVRNS